MTVTLTRCAVVLSAAALMAACAGSDTSAPAAPAASSSAAAPAPAASREPTTCELITGAEMSAIIGAEVRAAAGEDGASDQCTYKPGSGMMPSILLEVNRGAASAAMAATGILGRIEPGMTNPLDGLGDRAAQIGPQLWVQVGEDLLMITLLGVDDQVATAKRIVNTARPRMPTRSKT